MKLGEILKRRDFKKLEYYDDLERNPEVSSNLRTLMISSQGGELQVFTASPGDTLAITINGRFTWAVYEFNGHLVGNGALTGPVQLIIP